MQFIKSSNKDDSFFLVKNGQQTSINEANTPLISPQTTQFHEHYVRMVRVFVHAHPAVIGINMAIMIGCCIAYLFIDGRELVFALYIPLDILLNLGKIAFYFWQ